MALVSLLARLVLSAVFGVAGVAKLIDPAGSRRAASDFGAPAAMVGLVAGLLPLVELACAAMLLPTLSAQWGAAGSAFLLAIFTVAIAINLARGRRPDCHCFGQLSSEPIGASTVVRNVVLLALAAVILGAGPAPSLADSFVSASQSGTLVLTGALAALALALLGLWAIVHLLTQNGRLLLRVEAIERKVGLTGEARGLPVGTPAPAFDAETLGGGRTALGTLTQSRRPMLLVFSSPECSACEPLLPDVAAWQREHAERLTVVVVSRGDLVANRAKKNQFHLRNVVLQADHEIEQAYKISGTPSGVVVVDGSIADATAEGADAIRELVRKITVPPPIEQGASLPSLQIADLDGRVADAADVARNRTVIFWNPNCGFCRAMLDDLKAWEAARPRDARELLVVSSGTVDENRAQGFRAQVLLDPTFSLGAIVGASGTPAAVFIDARGRKASETVMGREAVLELAGIAPAGAVR